jgi:hypothetical protein
MAAHASDILRTEDFSRGTKQYWRQEIASKMMREFSGILTKRFPAHAALLAMKQSNGAPCGNNTPGEGIRLAITSEHGEECRSRLARLIDSPG